MQSAKVASMDDTPTGSVHKSRGNITVCMTVQLNMCCAVCCVLLVCLM